MDAESKQGQRNIRISLPSKGRLELESMSFLEECGLPVHKTNPRQYQASIPALPGLEVLLQRPSDIVVSVRDGSVDFGITGLDVLEERKGENQEILVLYDALDFGQCSLMMAVPEEWEKVQTMQDLKEHTTNLGRQLRVATKYPRLTGDKLNQMGIPHTLIAAEGTLEIAPAIGYADVICDLVSSGQTLKDNRLRPLSDGKVLDSQAVLVGNRHTLKTNPAVLAIARQLLEYIDAHQRASENLALFANMRGGSPEEIAARLFSNQEISGLQGPTISKVYAHEQSQNWYAVNIVVKRSQLFQAINELRAIGGSGVVVMPLTYIFEEEPPRYKAMLNALKEE